MSTREVKLSYKSNVREYTNSDY